MNPEGASVRYGSDHKLHLLLLLGLLEPDLQHFGCVHEIVDADFSTVMDGGLDAQLKVKIVHANAAREQKLRKKNLTKYIPNVAAAIFKVCSPCPVE